MQTFDVAIVGGGILGLATALQLLEQSPHLAVAIIEKESTVAYHQTGHNSGVIHSGIYYKPGSSKAINCRTGVKLLMEFCEKHAIPWETCGKVIIATQESELPRLQTLAERGLANGVPELEILDAKRLKEIEPNAAGIKALYSPKTAIVDFTRVAKQYAHVATTKGSALYLGEKVCSIHPTSSFIILSTDKRTLQTKQLINCAGAHADKIAKLAGLPLNHGRIIPFRGEYYKIRQEKSHLVRGLIYPVPDPKFPFLGVHLSKTMQGTIEAGPNAVLAFSREGYKYTDVDIRDCRDFLTYTGFWRMAAQHWKIGLYELYRSLRKGAFLKSLQRLVPELTGEDILPHNSGVRSQLIAPNGNMVDDFSILEDRRMIHVLNAPSPAATASLAIGKHIAAMAYKQLEC